MWGWIGMQLQWGLWLSMRKMCRRLVTLCVTKYTWYSGLHPIGLHIASCLYFLHVDPNTECPVTHPFVFNHGKHCCKANMEDVHSGEYNRTCDGSELSIYSSCCKDEAHVRCTDGKLCKDGNVNGGKIFIENKNWMQYFMHRKKIQQTSETFCRSR